MGSGARETLPAGWFPLTYDDYLAIPNDGKRYQILDGEIDVTPAPTTTHQKVSIRLAVALVTYVEANGLGLVLLAPVDVVLEETNVVQPDLVFVATERLAIVEEGRIAGAPDLVVEILSPGTAKVDRGVKCAIYARHGVRFYWLLDPKERLLEEYAHTGKGYELCGRFYAPDTFRPRLFEGLEIALASLFRP